MAESRQTRREQPLEMSAATLERGLEELRSAIALLASGPKKPITADYVRAAITAGDLRTEIVGDYFSDPAWPVFLHLYACHLDDEPMYVSELQERSNVPQSTLLRWVERLAEDGLIVRDSDRDDLRKIWVSLSDGAVERMRRYFEKRVVLRSL